MTGEAVTEISNLIYSVGDLLSDEVLKGIIFADYKRYQINKEFDVPDEFENVLSIQSMAGHYQSGLRDVVPAVLYWKEHHRLIEFETGIKFPKQLSRIAGYLQNPNMPAHQKYGALEDYVNADLSNVVPRDIAHVLHELNAIDMTAQQFLDFNQDLLEHAETLAYRLIDGNLPLGLFDEQGPAFMMPIFENEEHLIRTEDQRMKAISNLVFGLRMDEAKDRAAMSDVYFDDLTTNYGFGVCLPVFRYELKNPVFGRIFNLEDLSHLDTWHILVNRLEQGHRIRSNELIRSRRYDKKAIFEASEKLLFAENSPFYDMLHTSRTPINYSDNVVPGFIRLGKGPGGNDTAANVIAGVMEYMLATLFADIYDTIEKASSVGYFGGSDSRLLEDIKDHPTVRRAVEAYLPEDKFMHMLWFIQEYRRQGPSLGSVSVPYLLLKDSHKEGKGSTTLDETFRFLANLPASARKGEAIGINANRFIGYHDTPSGIFWDDLANRLIDSINHPMAPQTYIEAVEKYLGID